MKISCEIIKDLLPLYHDSVCSPESRHTVEEHLSCCDDCREELAAMNKDISITNKEGNVSEAEVIKSLSKRWKKRLNKSLLKGALIMLLVLLGLYLVLSVFFGIGFYVA